MKFKINEKIKHVSSPGIFTISKIGHHGILPVLWVNKRNGCTYESWDYEKMWRKITPYQMEFDFMSGDVNA